MDILFKMDEELLDRLYKSEDWLIRNNYNEWEEVKVENFIGGNMTLSDIESYIYKCIRILKFNELKSIKYNKTKAKIIERKLNRVLLEMTPIIYNIKAKVRVCKNKIVFNIYVDGISKELYIIEYNLSKQNTLIIRKY